MFKKMRRSDRQIGHTELEEILTKGLYGVLSTNGQAGYAYGVPLSYVYVDNSIYLHCAPDGQKLNNIRNNNRVSFCVVGKVNTLPEKFSTEYESVIVFGRAVEVHEDEKEKALLALIDKYSQEYREQGIEYIEKAKDRVTVIKIDVEYSTGKARR